MILNKVLNLKCFEKFERLRVGLVTVTFFSKTRCACSFAMNIHIDFNFQMRNGNLKF